MDWTKKFLARNISKTRVVINTLLIEPFGEHVISPATYSEDAIRQIKIFTDRGVIEVTNDFIEDKTFEDELDAENVSTETAEHTIFSPKEFKRTKAIDVNELKTDGKLTEVKEHRTDTPSLNIQEEDTVEAERVLEAQKFLQQHWKTLEVEVAKLFDVKHLEYLLDIANQLKLGAKKVEIIQNRIGELA